MENEWHSATHEPIDLEGHCRERNVELWIEGGECELQVFPIHGMHNRVIGNEEAVIDRGEIVEESLAKGDPWQHEDAAERESEPMPTAPIEGLHIPSMPENGFSWA